MSPTTITTPSGLLVVQGKKALKLLRFAEQAKTPGDRAELEKRMEAVAGPMEWKPFGGTGGRVPHSAIGGASDALHLATEPIMNMLDASLELEYLLAQLAGDPTIPQSTYEAAAHYFGLPSAGMAEWDTRKGQARRLLHEVAMRSQVEVTTGSSDGQATLTYLDQGCGQHPLRFDDTILSLQLGNKAEQPHQAGQFGHGAGLTLNYSEGGQILISRRHPDLLEDGQEDLVGLVVVRRFKPSQANSVHPSYMILVPKATGMPLAFSHEALGDPRWHGLRRTCIDFEIGAPINNVGDAASGGLYYHLDANLFSPPLPYAYRDERAATPQWRFQQGADSRLYSRSKGWAPRSRTKPIKVKLVKETAIDLTSFVGDGNDYGGVDARVYYVDQEGKRGSELYTPASAAEVWTLNGQVHSGRGRAHFARVPINLDAIHKNLVVRVVGDGLSADAKADIFTTDRQGTAARKITRLLQQAIDETLGQDPDLRRLDQEAKDEALRRAAGRTDRELEKALADFQHFVDREVEISAGPSKRKRRKGPPRPKPVVQPLPPISPLHKHPTFLRFRSKVRSTVRIEPGRSASVLLEADAVDDYFNQHPLTVTTSPNLGTAVRVYSQDKLNDGRMRIRLRADNSASPGQATLNASCLPPTATTPLAASIPLEVVPAKVGGDGSGRKRTERRSLPPKPVVLYEKIEPTWDSEGMDDWTVETVGEFKNEIAYINGDYKPLTRMLDQVPTDKRKDHLRLYLPPVAMALVSLSKEEKSPPTDSDDKAIPLHPQYRKASLLSAALGSIFTVRRLKKLGLGLDDEDE